MIRTRRFSLLVAIVLALPLAGIRPAAADTGSLLPTGLGLSAVPIQVASYNIPDGPATTVSLPPVLPPPGHSNLLWGYEASNEGVSGGVPARMFSYRINGAAITLENSCMPVPSENGRGVAFDPLDGNLWYTFVSFPDFEGDGMIHKTSPPPPEGTCTPVGQPLFVHAQGVNTQVQDDFGALDVDQGSMHIWAAGYRPIQVAGDPPGVLRSYFYLVDRNTGGIIQSCWIPFRGGGIGNDTLAYARIPGLPGSGQYLLTDAGEGDTTPNSIAVIDTADCHQGKLVAPVHEYAKVVKPQDSTSGIDYEWLGLVNGNPAAIDSFNNAVPGTSLLWLRGPLTAAETTIPEPPQASGDSTSLFGIEDISMCGFRAGGPGNDMCPY